MNMQFTNSIRRNVAYLKKTLISTKNTPKKSSKPQVFIDSLSKIDPLLQKHKPPVIKHKFSPYWLTFHGDEL